MVFLGYLGIKWYFKGFWVQNSVYKFIFIIFFLFAYIRLYSPFSKYFSYFSLYKFIFIFPCFSDQSDPKSGNYFFLQLREINKKVNIKINFYWFFGYFLKNMAKYGEIRQKNAKYICSYCVLLCIALFFCFLLFFLFFLFFLLFYFIYFSTFSHILCTVFPFIFVFV